MPKASTRKRPCAICRRWFFPDPRQIGRQRTCSEQCQRELHRRQCQRWNQKNKAYFKAIYVTQKIRRFKDPPESSQKILPSVIPASRIDLGLPKDVIIEIVGTELLIILDYIIEQIIHREPKRSPFRPP